MGYQWASDRIHQFVIDGMRDNEKSAAKHSVVYYPYVEPTANHGKGLLSAFAQDACVVVGDYYPCFFLPNMHNKAAHSLSVKLELVDSCGLLPLFATDRDFTTAYSFRRFLQKKLPPWLADTPNKDGLSCLKNKQIKVPSAITKKWSKTDLQTISLASIDIDHTVTPSQLVGGTKQAHRILQSFVVNRLPDYVENRNMALPSGTSGLSPYMHFGHISSHQIFDQIVKAEDWDPSKLSTATHGKRTGFWGMTPAAEAFFDQYITWRELGFVTCVHRKDYASYTSLPSWAQTTLAEHAKDPRVPQYTMEHWKSASTHDPLWNAAQTQLRREGVMHNYLRMLWGKKILHWSATPQQALQTMIHLNNKYALDGRDPNSYSGIFWTLGRYDRAWGPVRPIFGKVRYMTSASTLRKLRLKDYLLKYGGPTKSSSPGTPDANQLDLEL